MVAGTASATGGIKESIQKCKGFEDLSKSLTELNPSNDEETAFNSVSGELSPKPVENCKSFKEDALY